jgi:hypothetical protein
MREIPSSSDVEGVTSSISGTALDTGDQRLDRKFNLKYLQ